MNTERPSVRASRRVSKDFGSEKIRTLALSDLHLGRATTRAQAPETIAPLVEGFDRVLLLGDIVDHWYTTPSEARKLEERVRRVCTNAGVREVLYFRGNHDACIEEGEEFALLDGILYLHGHVLYHNLKGHGQLKERIRDLNDRKYGTRRQNSRSANRFWEVIDRMYGRIPMALMMPFRWPWPVARRIKAFVDEVAPGGGVHGVVLGHSHRPGVRRFRGLTLFNLGGWMTNTRAYGFVRAGSQVQLIHIDNRAQRLKWGKVLHACEFN
jgi:predicted phosphodiesterase